MGRLFWKFFFSILLAQLAATAAIGGAVWLKARAAAETRASDIETGPPAEMSIESAAATLAFGGTDGLRQLLENMPRHRVYAVGDDGKELLGRIASPGMISEAQKMLAGPDPRGVRSVSAPDGKRYLLFLPSRRHLGALDGPDSRPLLAGSGIPGLDPQVYRRHDFRRPPPPGDAAPPPPGEPGRGEAGGPPPRFRPLTPFIPIAAAVVASLLFAALLAWYFARPIRALRQAFDAAASGDLAPRFPAKQRAGGDELTTLGCDFDRMTARLRALLDGQKNLLHDVSHELRSPLARLQAAIGLAHQQPEKAATSMERIERESVRMDKLVGELLTLSRLEAGAVDAPSQQFSIGELLDEVLQDAKFEAATNGREVAYRGDADAQLNGQPELVARAIENVVRNAIKHSPDGGKVQVETELDARFIRIRVMDHGPGVAQEDLGKIFQPFYRSIGTEKDVDGHGLGLAIAQQVVQQHGGRIAAANRIGGGLCVELALPLPAA
ncbi:HAMP domain-containing sensor histidine kinase [Pseudoduganella violaceinigra]|uniref:HAMP domain-containing sensor histidine kinase n=1 Tax=Pseudoduganella violaceinigra TaxID=246602 RepID=UPI00040463BD|nr:ATP-binding protein [Pseudoduganella violaceinigra]